MKRLVENAGVVERMREPAARPTLEEVAVRAGVGRGTVSRVINNSPQVSPEARARVQRAIDELGYVPNRAARALVTNRTDSIALVVSESEGRFFEEPFFAGLVRGISAELADTELQLLLAIAQSTKDRERLDRHLTPQHVDGALLASLHGHDPLPEHLERRGVPTVLGGRPVGVDPVSYVDVDNRGGARQAVEYLIAQGRRRIATITGPQDMVVGVNRLKGYQDALRAAGIKRDPKLQANGDFSQHSGEAAMRTLLDRRPDLDAVFVASDLMAVGAMHQLRATNRSIPGDVAVIGFDNSVVARHTNPPLTTVNQPVEQMGRRMVQVLLARIQDPAATPQVELLETELVVRSSA
jgi:DNA-binding LacI/PurR family transcriptional regulator